MMNLTRVPSEAAWLRHIADSLLFQDLVPQGSSILDIGTGPGFPAWPLACARPDIHVTGLDSNGKMVSFLRTQPLPNLEVVQARAEDWRDCERYGVVTGRAVAPLPIQLELSAEPCRVRGAVIPMRTSADDPLAVKLAPLGLELESIQKRTLAGSGIERVFPIYRKTKPTRSGYPRRWAEIRAKPLA